jgi:hypothetical protein
VVYVSRGMDELFSTKKLHFWPDRANWLAAVTQPRAASSREPLFQVYPDEGHSLLSSRLHLYKSLEEFFDEHIPRTPDELLALLESQKSTESLPDLFDFV